jgi:hypothetical protein
VLNAEIIDAQSLLLNHLSNPYLAQISIGKTGVAPD